MASFIYRGTTDKLNPVDQLWLKRSEDGGNDIVAYLNGDPVEIDDEMHAKLEGRFILEPSSSSSSTTSATQPDPGLPAPAPTDPPAGVVEGTPSVPADQQASSSSAASKSTPNE
jgi:hypothetical protein